MRPTEPVAHPMLIPGSRWIAKKSKTGRPVKIVRVYRSYAWRGRPRDLVAYASRFSENTAAVGYFLAHYDSVQEAT